ncbi:hypothetical protein HanPSC8_Chr06g0242641 [Helianthus annuus]|nr:hypothetical protein HanPSC8_Chr06g0242641 [Helianthus annuus]
MAMVVRARLTELTQLESGHTVSWQVVNQSLSRFFRRVKCAKPDSNTLLWVSDLGCPFPPWPLPDPSELVLSGFRLFQARLRRFFIWLCNFISSGEVKCTPMI